MSKLRVGTIVDEAGTGAPNFSSGLTGTDGTFTGYVNVTAAVDGVQFVMSSGNIDAGVIKLYGVGPKQS